MSIRSLSEFVEFNSSFKTSINLYLSLNKEIKINSYIPTKSSVKFIAQYIENVLHNREQATLLVGPYGKGKSHLLLVLLAVLTMERTEENREIIDSLITKIRAIDEIGFSVADEINRAWEKDRFLPVIINDSTGDLNQSFLTALNDALKRENLEDLMPDTAFEIALERIKDWENDYPDTLKQFSKHLKEKKYTKDSLIDALKNKDNEALGAFKEIYPAVTAGSEFNPLAVSDVLPLYASVRDKLVEEHPFSGIYIVFDEFSKFIEGQEGKRVGKNMELLQKLCELAADSDKQKQIFITMVAHKSIKEYGKYLSSEIINSFTGIEGRITEKFYITSSKNNYELVEKSIIKDNSLLRRIPDYENIFEKNKSSFYNIPAFKSKFSEEDFNKIILKGCYPLNPIATYILLNISEKVAQNERTLFTFISNDEVNSMARYVSEHDETKDWVIGADLIYDYFRGLFKKDVSNELIHNIWLGAEYALSKVEDEAEKSVIKALAVILMVNKEEELPATSNYLALSVTCADAHGIINGLVSKDLIYQKGSSGSFVFKTRAGSELKQEIKKLRAIKGNNINNANALETVTGKYYVIPRKYNTVHMMTRYFRHQFMDVETFLNIEDSKTLLGDDFCDGKVITLFSFSAVKQDLVKKHYKKLNDNRVIVVAPKKTIKLEDQLRDYEIIQDLKADATFSNNNEILKRELPLMEEDLSAEIEGVYSDVYIEDHDCLVFYMQDNKLVVLNGNLDEVAVNRCCENIYTKTPIINNELVNRHRIGTAQTRKARVNIIKAILDHSDNEDFYSGTNQEATVYRSLFGKIKEDGLLNEIIERINDFVDSCSDKKLPIRILIDELVSAPYGMRLGVIPIYFAFVLSKRHEDLVVYYSDMEIALDAEILVNMCETPDDYALFVSGEDILKEKYIGSLKDTFAIKENKNLSENRIKDIVLCMQRWYRALPQVTRNLVSIDLFNGDEDLKHRMQILRKNLQQVEFNPYEILFVKIPELYEAESLEETYHYIDECKTAFDDYYDWITRKVVAAIYSVYGGKRKKDLYHLLNEWYEKRSDYSKQGLHDGRITNYMSCIKQLSVYNDAEVARKIAKAVTGVYVENWNDSTYHEFCSELGNIKNDCEKISDEEATGKMVFSFTNTKGEKVKLPYDKVSESTGTVLRNIIEDTLDEYDDMSVNDRVAILIEMIEKVIG